MGASTVCRATHKMIHRMPIYFAFEYRRMEKMGNVSISSLISFIRSVHKERTMIGVMCDRPKPKLLQCHYAEHRCMKHVTCKRFLTFWFKMMLWHWIGLGLGEIQEWCRVDFLISFFRNAEGFFRTCGLTATEDFNETFSLLLLYFFGTRVKPLISCFHKNFALFLSIYVERGFFITFSTLRVILAAEKWN